MEKERAAAYRKEAMQLNPFEDSSGYVRGNLNMSQEDEMKLNSRTLDAEVLQIHPQILTVICIFHLH